MPFGTSYPYFGTLKNLDRQKNEIKFLKCLFNDYLDLRLTNNNYSVAPCIDFTVVISKYEYTPTSFYAINPPKKM